MLVEINEASFLQGAFTAYDLSLQRGYTAFIGWDPVHAGFAPSDYLVLLDSRSLRRKIHEEGSSSHPISKGGNTHQRRLPDENKLFGEFVLLLYALFKTANGNPRGPYLLIIKVMVWSVGVPCFPPGM